MTGSILFHKELVPNYGLMSNVQDAISQKEKVAPSPSTKQSLSNSDALKKPPPTVETYNVDSIFKDALN